MKFFEQSIKGQLNSYNLILFHSLNMVSALLSNKMIAFYEIYEEFDKLNNHKNKQLIIYNVRKEATEFVYSAADTTIIYE